MVLLFLMGLARKSKPALIMMLLPMVWKKRMLLPTMMTVMVMVMVIILIQKMVVMVSR